MCGEGGCSTGRVRDLLVVKDHVRQPDVFGGQPDLQHPIKLLRHPRQTIVLPLLKYQKKKNKQTNTALSERSVRGTSTTAESTVHTVLLWNFMDDCTAPVLSVFTYTFSLFGHKPNSIMAVNSAVRLHLAVGKYAHQQIFLHPACDLVCSGGGIIVFRTLEVGL